ncbi:discoidin domain-containing protein [Streptomyces sp. NBC_00669]|uniref:glycoside hydrolase family 2 protein n=1 Tax=Streptomyces sp. NBC_00669 TaxID=2976011 RepID=UPI002E2F5FA0|nr:sugar-binding domain-containing protein [Streptomyces sp. NBC_00669]
MNNQHEQRSSALVPTRRQLLTLGAATAAAVGLQRIGAAQAAAPGDGGFAAPRTGGAQVLQSLNGTWDFLPAAAGAAYPPADSGWADIPVPAEWNMAAGPFATGWDAYDLFETPDDWNTVDTAWYRRTVRVPAAAKGQRIVLRFEAVNFEATVWFNGAQVAHHQDGLLPFEADVTDHAVFGGSNTVHLLVRSPGSARQSDGYHFPGGSWWGQEAAGIWQDVWLLARNPVSTADTAIVTSVTDKKLTATTVLRNDSAADATVRVDHTVWDGARQVLRLSRQVTVPAGGTTAVEESAGWSKPRLWNPADPHLYELRVDIRASGTGPVLDSTTQRFGFREVTVDGPALLLNGEPQLLRGDSWHYMGSVQNSRAYAEMWMRMAMAAGVNYMRLHAMPYPPVYYDVADELGMMIVGESGIYGSSGNYAMGADDFWANCATHLKDRVVRDRNHPSIIAWSAENEMLAAFGQSYVPQVAALKPPVLAEDTSRPVYFEGDGDPQGAGDLRSTHYPVEITTKNTTIPESGRVLAVGQPRGDEWDRKKPFLISEFSSMYYANPSDVSALGGPAAYADLDGFWSAHALTVRAQIEGFRYAGITAISPWNTVWYGMQPLPFDGTSVPKPDPSGSGPRLKRVGPFAATLNPGFQKGLPDWRPNPIHGSVARVFQPVAALALDYRTHYFGGSTLAKDLMVCNDTAGKVKLTVGWTLSGKGIPTGKGSAKVTVAATDRGSVTAKLALPKVKKATAATLRITVSGDGTFTDDIALTLYPAPAGKLGTPLKAAVLEGTSGAATTKALTALGVTARTVADFGTLPDPASGEVLVVAEGAEPAADTDAGKKVTTFVAAGGQVLVLAQSAFPQILPWPQFSTSSPQTVTHVAAPHHPVLAGIGADDLRWWQTADETVVSTVLLKPRFGSLLSLADAGSALAATALAETRFGKGRYLICQYPVVAAQAAEPIAAALLRNLLGYVARPAAATGRFGVLAADDKSAAAVTLKAAAADLTVLGTVDADALAALDILLVDASPGNDAPLASLKAAAAAVTAWTGQGGTLWISGATPDTWASVAPFLPSGAKLTAVDADHAHGAVTTGNSALTTGVSNADLDWPGAGAPLVAYTVQAKGGTSAVDTRAVAWSLFSAGNEQTKYGKAAHSTLGFTAGSALWQTAAGQGSVIVDQLLWPDKNALPTQVGLAALLAANVGTAFAAGAGSGELPTDGWKGFTNPAGGTPANAYDRNPSTRWTSSTARQPGMYYGLDLGASHTIDKIVWDASASSGDVPSAADLLVSTDNSTWTTVLSLADTAPYTSGGVMTLNFDPVDVRYFKVVNTKAAGNYLSVHEIYVYTATQ